MATRDEKKLGFYISLGFRFLGFLTFSHLSVRCKNVFFYVLRFCHVFFVFFADVFFYFVLFFLCA